MDMDTVACSDARDREKNPIFGTNSTVYLLQQLRTFWFICTFLGKNVIKKKFYGIKAESKNYNLKTKPTTEQCGVWST